MDKETPYGIDGWKDPRLGNPRQVRRVYEIRVRDHLETYWFEWFEGWTVSNLKSGEVLLRHPGLDQSGLHGALNKIRDLNLILISVSLVDKPLAQSDY